jgi:hypothetical protein
MIAFSMRVPLRRAARASHEMAFQNKKQLARAKNVFGFFDRPSH